MLWIVLLILLLFFLVAAGAFCIALSARDRVLELEARIEMLELIETELRKDEKDEEWSEESSLTPSAKPQE